MKKLFLIILLLFSFSMVLPYSANALWPFNGDENFNNEGQCNAWCSDDMCSAVCPITTQAGLFDNCVQNCKTAFCAGADYNGGLNITVAQTNPWGTTFQENYPSCIWTTEAQCTDYCNTTVCPAACPGGDEAAISACQTDCDDNNCDATAWNNIQPGQFQAYENSYRSAHPECGASGSDSDGSGSSIITTTYETEELGNPIGATSTIEIVGNVTQALLALLGAASLIVFIYGGIMMMTAAGNEERVKKAKSTLIWAVLGIAIILASYSILEFVFDIFTPAS